MTETLSEPLIPAHIDLRGLEYMPLMGARLFSSDFELEATDAEFRAGVRLWWASWNQVPAGSLPTSDRSLAKLAGFGDEVAKWRKVKERALWGFVACNDGRLYHAILCEQALIAWEKRVDEQAKRKAENERKARERAERSRMFEQLRAVGVTPRWNVPTAELRQLVTQHVTDAVTPPVTRTVTPNVTAKTVRDETVHKDSSPAHAKSTSNSDGASEGPFAPTLAGQVGLAVKAAGVDPTTINLSDVRLAEMLRQGATPDEFAGLAREAVAKGIGGAWAWVLKVLPERRKQAQAMQLAPKVEQQETPRQRAARERTEEAAGVYAGHIAKPAPTTGGAKDALPIKDDEVIHVDRTAIPFDLGDD